MLELTVIGSESSKMGSCGGSVGCVANGGEEDVANGGEEDVANGGEEDVVYPDTVDCRAYPDTIDCLEYSDTVGCAANGMDTRDAIVPGAVHADDDIDGTKDGAAELVNDGIDASS